MEHTNIFFALTGRDGTLTRNMFCDGLVGVQTGHGGRVKFEDEE